MFLLTGLTTLMAVGIKTKASEDSWIRIIAPEEGSSVTMPLTIETEGSSDIDFMAIGLYYDSGQGNPSYHWPYEYHDLTPFEPVEWNESLEPGETFKIKVSGYKIDGKRGYLVANDVVELSIKKDKSINKGVSSVVLSKLLENHLYLFTILQRVIDLTTFK